MIFILQGQFFDHTGITIQDTVDGSAVVVTSSGIRLEGQGIKAEQIASIIQNALATEAGTPGTTTEPIDI